MATIQGVYVALFGRPADPTGLAYFNSITNNGANLNAIANLSGTAEYQARFTGQNNIQIINSIYQSLFGRDADITGLNFFANQLATGRQTINTIAINILDGAVGSDLTIVNNKIAAANLYTAALDTGSEVVAYSGTAAADAGRTFISGVTTTVPTAAQVDAAVAVMVANAPANGSTFSLTTGVDNIVGTSNNDVINGLSAVTAAATTDTLTAADVIDGGAGTDTLNITVTGANTDVTHGAQVRNVEIISIRNAAATAGGTATVNATGFEGVVATGTGDVTVTNLASGKFFSANGASGAAVIAQGYTAAATNSVTNLSGATLGNLTITGAGLTTAAINASGGANTAAAVDVAGAKTINIDATSNLTVTSIATSGTEATINVKGGATSVSLGTLDTDIIKLDASGLTAGGVTATLSATATTAVTGGAGNDTITTGAVLTTGSVAAGNGTDRLVVADTTHVATAALAAKYTGFEAVQVQNGVAQDVSLLSGIASVFINDGASGATAVNNLSAAQAGAITVIAGDGAAIIGVKDASNVGQIDTVKLTFNDGNTTLNQDINASSSTFTLAGVENLEVTAVDQIDITQSAAASGALSSVKLFGAGDATFITGNMATSNFSVDGSAATGKLTLNATNFATNGVALTGGSNDDTLTGSAQADIIKGGAGKDTINGLAGKDTIDGGAGVDTIVVGAANQQDVITGGADADTFKFTDTTDFAGMLKTSAGTAGVVRITDFVAGTDKINLDVDTGVAVSGTSFALSAAQTIATAADLAGVYAGITAIAASTAGGALNGAVITVSAGAAAGTYLYVNDATGAVSNTDDMLINITGITGTLTASDITLS